MCYKFSDNVKYLQFARQSHWQVSTLGVSTVGAGGREEDNQEELLVLELAGLCGI